METLRLPVKSIFSAEMNSQSLLLWGTATRALQPTCCNLWQHRSMAIGNHTSANGGGWK
jgi:hypothetical protein